MVCAGSRDLVSFCSICEEMRQGQGIVIAKSGVRVSLGSLVVVPSSTLLSSL